MWFFCSFGGARFLTAEKVRQWGQTATIFASLLPRGVSAPSLLPVHAMTASGRGNSKTELWQSNMHPKGSKGNYVYRLSWKGRWGNASNGVFFTKGLKRHFLDSKKEAVTSLHVGRSGVGKRGLTAGLKNEESKRQNLNHRARIQKTTGMP